jgi:hypothetical protein
MGAPAVSALVKVLGRGRAEAADASIKALAQIGLPAVEPLISLVITGDDKTARLAGQALIAVGAPAVPDLVKALRQIKMKK